MEKQKNISTVKIFWNNFKKYLATVVSETSVFKITLIELNTRVNGKTDEPMLVFNPLLSANMSSFFSVLETVSPLLPLGDCFGARPT